MDPYGHMTTKYYGDWLSKGWDIRPTIAVTKGACQLQCRNVMDSVDVVPLRISVARLYVCM